MLLSFFFVNRPKTLIPFVIGLGMIFFFAGCAFYNWRIDSSGSNSASHSICEWLGFLAFAAAICLLTCCDKIIIFSFAYALFLTESMLFKENGSLKIKGIDLATLRRPLRKCNQFLLYFYLPLQGLILLTSITKATCLIYAILFIPSLVAATLMTAGIACYLTTKWVSLGLIHNEKWKDFQLNDLYGELRTLLIEQGVLGKTKTEGQQL